MKVADGRNMKNEIGKIDQHEISLGLAVFYLLRSISCHVFSMVAIHYTQ